MNLYERIREFMGLEPSATSRARRHARYQPRPAHSSWDATKRQRAADEAQRRRDREWDEHDSRSQMWMVGIEHHEHTPAGGWDYEDFRSEGDERALEGGPWESPDDTPADPVQQPEPGTISEPPPAPAPDPTPAPSYDPGPSSTSSYDSGSSSSW